MEWRSPLVYRRYLLYNLAKTKKFRGPLCDGEKKHMKKLSRELIYAALHSDVHDAAKSKEPNSKNGSGGLVLLTLPP